MTHCSGDLVGRGLQRKLLNLCLIVYCAAISSHVWAKPTYKIVPLKVLAGQEKAVLYLPCDAKYVGIVANEKSSTLAIGAMIELPKVQCIAVPKPMVVSVSSINVSKYSSVYPMKLGHLKGRYFISELQSVQSVENSSLVQVGFAEDCQQVFGYLVRESYNDAAQVFVSLVKYEAAPTKNKCASKGSIANLSFFNKKRVSSYSINQVRNVSLKKAYRLELAPLVKSPFKTLNGNIVIRAEIMCGRSPIGFLTQGDGESLRVGVLVGHFYNASENCHHASKLVDISLASIDVSNKSLRPMNQKRHILNNHQFLTPIRIDQDKSKDLVRLDYTSHCDKPVYEVLPVSSSRKVIGLLEARAGEDCARPVRHSSKVINYLSFAKGDTIYPMVLKHLPTRI